MFLLGGGGYYYYQNIYLPSQKPTIEVEKNKVSISKYYIYGTHLNIIGEIKKINAKFTDVDLIFWNTKTGKIKIACIINGKSRYSAESVFALLNKPVPVEYQN